MHNATRSHAIRQSTERRHPPIPDGVLGDRLGRGRVLAVGLTVFVLASAVALAAMRRCFEIWAEDGGTQDLPDMIDHALAVVQRGLDLKA